MPRFSIVTVVRNDAAGVVATLNSVFSQTFSSYECIVQDGASTDGTVDAIKGFGDWVDIFESTPDTGIYQAMNRAVAKASGDFVLFLNADDAFATSKTLEELARSLLPEDQIVYGRACSRETGKVWPYRPLDLYWTGMTFDHQATAISRDLLLSSPYDEALRIAGDLDFFSKQRGLGTRLRDVELVVAVKPFAVGASSSFLARFDERRRVLTRHFGDDFPVELRLRNELVRYASSVIGETAAKARWKEASIEEMQTDLEYVMSRLGSGGTGLLHG